LQEDLSKQSHATREAVEKYEQLASATKVEKVRTFSLIADLAEHSEELVCDLFVR
jgi:hypothetical protein